MTLVPESQEVPESLDPFGLLRWGFLVADPRAWAVVRSPTWHGELLAAAAARGLDNLPETIHRLHDAAKEFDDREAWEAACRDLFDGNVRCPPYETDYTCTHAFMQAQQLADISGFYKAFGFAPADGIAERVDHIGLQCEFLYLLGASGPEATSLPGGATSARIDARRKFLQDHLGRYTAAFAQRAEATASGFFVALSLVTHAFVQAEVASLGLHPAALPDRAGLLSQEPDTPTCGACPTDALSADAPAASS